jgi:hypothetical protein
MSNTYALKEMYQGLKPRPSVVELAYELNFIYHPGRLNWEDEMDEAAKMIEAFIQLELE